MSVSVDGYRLRVVDGRQSVNGRECSAFVDERARTITVTDDGNPAHVAAAAFHAGRVAMKLSRKPVKVDQNVSPADALRRAPRYPLRPSPDEGSPQGLE